MRPTVNAALGVALLATLGGLSPVVPRRRAPKPVAHAVPSASETELSAVCPPRTIPDGVACVPLPSPTVEALDERHNAHRERSGELREYDQIPRRPDRPESWDAYALPIPAKGSDVVSGYDLDENDEAQRRGPSLRAIGHGGVDLVAKRGTEVRSMALDGEGPPENVVDRVLWAGPLFGNTVVVEHVLHEGGRDRSYVVLHGHLDRIADGIAKGASVVPGTVLGFVGDSGSKGIVHLHLEIRRAREGVDPAELGPDKLVANDKTVPVDPRNVLPLR